MKGEQGRGLTRRNVLAAGLASVAVTGGAAIYIHSRGEGAILARRCRFGAYSSTGGDLIRDHRSLEELVGALLPVFSWFKDWGSGWDAELAGAMAGGGHPYDCLMAWEAWDVAFDDILSGQRDAFLAGFFDGARAYPGRVIIRLFHEMNGDWYPWAVVHDGAAVADVGQFQQAWRHIVDVARDRGANNVQFMFCVNNEDVGSVPMEKYWPGVDYVDIVGVDGYNWGWTREGQPEQSAEDIIDPMYRRLTALHPDAEFMVGELGCAPHVNKSRWFEDLYRSSRFPRLTAIAFFNESKERDWRLNSDAATLQVNRRYLSQGES